MIRGRSPFGNRRFGGSFPLWTPRELGDSLRFWVDADDASTITLNGSTVSEWRDKSGKNRHASQSVASNQPTYTTNGLNGRSVITFNSTNQTHLITPSFQLGDNAVTVARRTSRNAPVIETPGNVLRRGLWGTAYSGFVTHLLYGINGQTPIAAAPDSAVNAPVMVTQTSLFNTDSNSWYLGYGTPSYTFLDGYISEVVICDTLSLLNLQRLEGYLAWKWGLVANLPSNHPFKTDPPRIG